MLLPLLIFIPFIGGLICWKSTYINNSLPCWIALISMIISLYLIILEWIFLQKNNFIFQKNNFFQWKDEFFVKWIPSFGINFHFAIDELSLIMISLTIILGIISILCSWNKIKKFNGFFYFNLLFVLSGIIGIFLSIDLFLFFFFWEIILIPISFLIILYGNKKNTIKYNIFSIKKFFIYSQFGSLLMLISILSLVIIHYYSTKVLTFDYELLLKTKMSNLHEYLIMIGFFLPFAIKIPLIPFHGWLPSLHKSSSTNGSIDISSLIIKTSYYGLIRFIIPIFPHASYKFSFIAIIIGIFNIIYGSFVSFSQNNIKKMISYLSISHMGFLLISIYSFNHLVYQGIIIQIICHTLSICALFIISSQLYKIVKTNNINKMGGLLKDLKYIQTFSFFFILCMIGVPGTGNFIGEITMLIGLYNIYPIITILVICGIFFYSINLLNMIFRIYYGPIKLNNFIKKTNIYEYLILIFISFIIIFIGFFPKLIIDITSILMKKTCNIVLHKF
ncbi:NADH-quinone oxidoreductase subunit M [Sodalis-like secondary symbiont of Drepanosiphum platanoidis]|uniref:NADH-quinone oxidoreductase subunit M n=1 Tax=Sodalis-like secondary symbiont of Drepanosiphum platanoidis TaxID=2994493 RepID=UPI0034647EDE